MDEKKESLLIKLSLLRKKEEELSSLIRSIDVTFLDMGYRIDATSDLIQKINKPQTGIKINNKLSFRGIEKSDEYFDLIDNDNDGMLNFEDFRAIHAFGDKYGSVEDVEYEHFEAWKIYLDDMNLKLTAEGGITKDQFRKYREVIEIKQPLSNELCYLELGYLPIPLKKWSLMKQLLMEQLEFRESRLPANQVSGVRDEIFTFEELPYILNNADFGITKLEIFELMIFHCRKKKLLIQLVRTYARLNLSQPSFPFNVDNKSKLLLRLKESEQVVTVDEVMAIHSKELLPWMLACPHYLFNQKELYRQFIKLKYKLGSYLRYMESISRVMFNFGAHMNDRLVFRDFLPVSKLSKTLNEVSTYRFGISIGDEQRREGGCSGAFKLTKIDNPPQLFRKMQLSSDSGSVVIIDLLYHVGTASVDMETCASVLRQFLGHHFEKELRGNRMFSGLNVINTVNESDDMKVLRITLCYKRIVSIDGWFEQMLIPYSLTDLLEICNSKLTNLSEHLNLSIDCTVGLKRNLTIALLERLGLAISAGLTAEQVDALNPIMENESIILSVQEEDRKRRILRWQYLFNYFPYIKSCSSWLLKTLQCMKVASFRLAYNSIGEFVYKLGLQNYWFSRYLPTKWFFQVAKARQVYYKYCDIFKAQFTDLHLQLKSYLEGKKEAENIRRIKELMEMQNVSINNKNGDTAETLDKLRSLGIDTSAGGADIFKDDTINPEEHATYIKDGIYKQDILNLITIENLRKHLIGIHSCDIISGKAKVSITIQGLDIFELLPELPNMMKVQEDNIIKPRKKGNKSE